VSRWTSAATGGPQLFPSTIFEKCRVIHHPHGSHLTSCATPARRLRGATPPAVDIIELWLDPSDQESGGTSPGPLTGAGNLTKCATLPMGVARPPSVPRSPDRRHKPLQAWEVCLPAVFSATCGRGEDRPGCLVLPADVAGCGDAPPSGPPHTHTHRDSVAHTPTHLLPAPTSPAPCLPPPAYVVPAHAMYSKMME